MCIRDRNTRGAVILHVPGAVLKDHHCRRFTRLILRGHVDPIVARRTWVDLACRPRMLRHLALRDAGLARRIGAVRIVGGGQERRGEPREQHRAHMRKMVSRKPCENEEFPSAMHDLNYFRNNLEAIATRLADRGFVLNVDEFRALDTCLLYTSPSPRDS